MMIRNIIIDIYFIGAVAFVVAFAATFYEQSEQQNGEIKEVLSVTDEPSALQCAQRCRFANKMASIRYKAPRCKCIILKKAGDGVVLDKSPTVESFQESWVNGSCSTTCDPGTLQQTRECTNPPHAYGGAKCVGAKTRSIPCNVAACPIDGGFSNWINGSCSTTCGPGYLQQTRECTNPPPAYGGAECIGSKNRSIPCDVAECPLISLRCGSNSTASRGYMTSPNYPGNYPNSYECRSRISGPDNTQIKVTIADMELESGYDYLELESNSLSKKYNESILESITVMIYSSSLTLTFRSDNSATRRGFKLTWEFF